VLAAGGLHHLAPLLNIAALCIAAGGLHHLAPLLSIAALCIVAGAVMPPRLRVRGRR
jgi:hypothetical protein